MKLLLDENLSRRLIPFLQHDYPGSSQVVLLGLEAASEMWSNTCAVRCRWISKKTRQLLGWRPPLTLDQGLKKVAEGYVRETGV